MQIKIRAWDKDSETMIYGVGITPESDGGIPYQIPVNAHDFDQFDYYPNSIIMLYTGLKDKNGIEIYEGDLLQHPNGTIAEIKYLKDLAAFVAIYKQNGNTEIDYLDKEIINECIIVGNIYKNQELLEGEK